jgi:hypothetical protein
MSDQEYDFDNIDIRQKQSELLPFFLRSWWLKDSSEYAHILWPSADLIQSQLWTMFCDPLCDNAQISELEDFK